MTHPDGWEHSIRILVFQRFTIECSETHGSERWRLNRLYPPNLSQPELILPFLIDQLWSYTGGPHGAWERDGARAAIDFAPGSTESGCVESNAWVVAAAPGLIVRAGNGAIVEDLDGDGNEQTGWDILYLHVNDLADRSW